MVPHGNLAGAGGSDGLEEVQRHGLAAELLERVLAVADPVGALEFRRQVPNAPRAASSPGRKGQTTDKGERCDLRISYLSLEQLDGLLARLRGEPVPGSGEPEPGGEDYHEVKDYLRGEEGG